VSEQPDEIQNLRIEPFEPTDLDDIMAIEVVSFSMPWSRRSYEEIIPLDSVLTIVARIDGELVGYALMQYVNDEMELHTFAVKSAWRRKGIGSKLLERMLSEAVAHDAKNIFLLVRPNNPAARTIYDKFGFEAVGIRPLYYKDTGEDAIVMKLSLDKQSLVVGR